MHVQNLALGRSTPVLDHNGVCLYRASRERATALLEAKNADPTIKAGRIKAIRLRGPDPALSLSGSHARRGLGSPHQQESYFNVRGVWHLDRIPDRLVEHFTSVVQDRIKN